MARKSKTAEQQAKFYRVGKTAIDFFHYLIRIYICGNNVGLKVRYKEMNKIARLQFLEYVTDVNNVVANDLKKKIFFTINDNKLSQHFL